MSNYKLIKKHLLTTSSAINTSMLALTLLMSPAVKANNQKEYEYNSTIEFVTKFSKKRNLGELDYMHPLLSNQNDLFATDIKLKLDNNKSKEVNVGLLYRHNYNDKVIIGTYGYFDHRRTANISVSGATFGVEALSKYVDARANIYIPQNIRKQLSYNTEKSVEINGTSIYATSGGNRYESVLRGYDIELGTSVFAFSDELNARFGTKIFVARYNFKNKKIKVEGTRFRLEQNLFKFSFKDNSMKVNLNAETQYDKVSKRQTFVGIGAKIDLNDKKALKRLGGLKPRMMETVIRDVDIPTVDAYEPKRKYTFFDSNGRKITDFIYVGLSNNDGEGTKEKPYSRSQLKKKDLSTAIVNIVANKTNNSSTNTTSAASTTSANKKEVASIIRDVKRSGGDVANNKKIELTTKNKASKQLVTSSNDNDKDDDIVVIIDRTKSSVTAIKTNGKVDVVHNNVTVKKAKNKNDVEKTNNVTTNATTSNVIRNDINDREEEDIIELHDHTSNSNVESNIVDVENSRLQQELDQEIDKQDNIVKRAVESLGNRAPKEEAEKIAREQLASRIEEDIDEIDHTALQEEVERRVRETPREMEARLLREREAERLIETREAEARRIAEEEELQRIQREEERLASRVSINLLSSSARSSANLSSSL